MAGRPLTYSLAVCHMLSGLEAPCIQISGLSHVAGTSTSTEIEISPYAIMKNHKNGFSLVSVGPREKV